MPYPCEWASDTNAYMYEKIGFPVKGAYIRRPKFLPRFLVPHIEDMILGKTVKMVL